MSFFQFAMLAVMAFFAIKAVFFSKSSGLIRLSMILLAAGVSIQVLTSAEQALWDWTGIVLTLMACVAIFIDNRRTQKPASH